jgi:hypothetical protein
VGEFDRPHPGEFELTVRGTAAGVALALGYVAYVSFGVSRQIIREDALLFAAAIGGFLLVAVFTNRSGNHK